MGSMEEKKVLVTGATGFVGSNLTAKLVEAGAEVNIVSRDKDVSKNLILKNLGQDIKVHRCNLEDFGEVEKCLETISPEVVYHLGAVVNLARSFKVAHECMTTNVLGTLNMLHICDSMELESFLFTSTCDVYKSGEIPFRESGAIEPKSPYAISKAACEQMCMFIHENYGIPTVVLRLSTIYGPNQKSERVIPYTIISCLKKGNLSFTSGKQTRDFTYVDDVVDGIIKASFEKNAVGEIINLGSDMEYSVKEIVLKIINLMGYDRRPNFGTIPNRNSEVPRWVCDITKAKKMLGWAPETSIDEGLKKTIAWYKGRI